MTARSIATVSLSGSLDEKLRAVAAAGFDAVEIFENDLLTFNGSPRDVGKLCRDLGLSICAFLFLTHLLLVLLHENVDGGEADDKDQHHHR